MLHAFGKLGALILFAAMIPSTSAEVASSPGIHHHPLPDSATSYGYLSFLPKEYDAKNGKHPLVIFLHGQGQLGNGKEQLNMLFKNGPFALLKKDPAIFDQASCVVLAPQGLIDDKWWKLDKLEAFLEFALKHYAVDTDRVYLTGLSMGGGPTWQLADKHPDTFAAIVPICGASRPPQDRAAKIKAPIWAFHSVNDPRVRFTSTEMWLNSVAGDKAAALMDAYPKQGTQSASFDGNKWSWSEGQHAPATAVGITVFPEDQHDSWTRAYADPKLWEWLFARKR